MCSCNNKTRQGGTQNFTHVYVADGKTVSKTYSSEMEARRRASLLGGTVKPA